MGVVAAGGRREGKPQSALKRNAQRKHKDKPGRRDGQTNQKHKNSIENILLTRSAAASKTMVMSGGPDTAGLITAGPFGKDPWRGKGVVGKGDLGEKPNTQNTEIGHKMGRQGSDVDDNLCIPR